MAKFEFPDVDEISRKNAASLKRRNKDMVDNLQKIHEEQMELDAYFKSLPLKHLSNIENQLAECHEEIDKLKNELKERDKKNTKLAWRIAIFGVIAPIVISYLYNRFLG